MSDISVQRPSLFIIMVTWPMLVTEPADVQYIRWTGYCQMDLLIARLARDDVTNGAEGTALCQSADVGRRNRERRRSLHLLRT